MNRSALTRSALNRVGRVALQFAAGYLTVEIITEWIGKLQLDSDTKALLIGIATPIYTFLHRRYLDASSIPSLVDGEAAAGTEYEGRHVRDDGLGPT